MIRANRYSQPSADVDITAWDLRGSKEGVAAVTSSAGNLDRVATAVRFGSVERYCTSLVAIGSVRSPSCLVPSAFEVVGDLSQRQGKQGECSEAKRAEHDREWKIGRPEERLRSVCQTLLEQR